MTDTKRLEQYLNRQFPTYSIHVQPDPNTGKDGFLICVDYSPADVEEIKRVVQEFIGDVNWGKLRYRFA